MDASLRVADCGLSRALATVEVVGGDGSRGRSQSEMFLASCHICHYLETSSSFVLITPAVN